MDRLAATLALNEPVERVPLVSPTRARTLSKLGISTVRDLVTHYPHRYVDLSAVETIANAVIGRPYTICGTIHELKLKQPRPKLSLVEISVVDDTGLLMVTVFRQPWLMESLKRGQRLAVAGTVEFNYGFKRMTNPFIEVLQDSTNDDVGIIIPVHPATEKLSAAWIRRFVSNGLDLIRGVYDPLPLELRLRYRLMSRNQALRCMHFPRTMDEQHEAQRRLAYEELLLLELFLMEGSQKRSEGKAVTTHVIDGNHVRALMESLPFELTGEQVKAKDDLLREMARPCAMNHMILGDVGTGKTIVAALGLAAVADTGTQALFMAPTEVLATQHARNLGPVLEDAGITYELLTGSTPHDARALLLERFAAGTVDVLIGTHVLLEPDVVAKRVSLVIIDEQQRFGVDQRAKLLEKGPAPDALFLTATPIPRSMALALFGNLTLSYIKERPHNTAPRSTYVLPRADQGIAFDAAKEALARGEQVFVVCPLIGKNGDERDKKAKRKSKAGPKDLFEDSGEDTLPLISIEDESDFSDDDPVAAETEAAFLQDTVFPDYRVELLHGQMPSADKQAVMERFRQGEIQVLVSTTVIEVGVDVPNATVMIVEDADRFGLSQLHQLRGRVGRGNLPGSVYLISASKQESALARLAAMESTDDGFELASFDLSLRREGDILGNRQHGASALKLVNVVRDAAIIEAAHSDAQSIIEVDPHLELPAHRILGREMRLLFQGDHNVVGG